MDQTRYICSETVDDNPSFAEAQGVSLNKRAYLI